MLKVIKTIIEYSASIALFIGALAFFYYLLTGHLLGSDFVILRHKVPKNPAFGDLTRSEVE